MALNFPDSPTLNQVYTDTTSGFSYQWDGVVWKSYASSASSQIKILDDISGSFNGSTSVFPITISGTSFAPANAQQLRIVLGGIVQEPIADYVVSGSNISFTTPPGSGLSFSGVSLGPALPGVGIASTGTVYVRQQYSPTGVQTTFTFASGYTPGFLEVYHNGSKLVSGDDYTPSNGSTFDLTTPAQNGDDVEGIAYLITELYSITGLLNNLVVSGNATVGGITTLGNVVKVGSGSTALIVEGDARVTGILTIGTSSITLDGTNNEIKIGTGITLSNGDINFTGSLYQNGTLFSSGEWVSTDVGIHTLSDVGIGTTNPSTKLSVGGSITELSQGQYWNVVTQADVGIGASQIPLNQHLGQLAFLDEFGTNIPQNAQTASYTLVRADAGKHISITTGGVTVPAGVFEVGDAVTIYNNSGSNQTITQGGSVTMRFAGAANTGNRTLAQYGLCTVLCVASNTFVISGVGLS